MLVAKLETVYTDSGDNGSSQVSLKLIFFLIVRCMERFSKSSCFACEKRDLEN